MNDISCQKTLQDCIGKACLLMKMYFTLRFKQPRASFLVKLHKRSDDCSSISTLSCFSFNEFPGAWSVGYQWREVKTWLRINYLISDKNNLRKPVSRAVYTISSASILVHHFWLGHWFLHILLPWEGLNQKNLLHRYHQRTSFFPQSSNQQPSLAGPWYQVLVFQLWLCSAVERHCHYISWWTSLMLTCITRKTSARKLIRKIHARIIKKTATY